MLFYVVDADPSCILILYVQTWLLLLPAADGARVSEASSVSNLGKLPEPGRDIDVWKRPAASETT